MMRDEHRISMMPGGESQYDSFARDLFSLCKFPVEFDSRFIKFSDDMYAGLYTRLFVFKFGDLRTSITVRVNFEQFGFENCDDKLIWDVIALTKLYFYDSQFSLLKPDKLRIFNSCSVHDNSFSVNDILLSNDMSEWNEKSAIFNDAHEFFSFSLAHRDKLSIAYREDIFVEQILDKSNNMFDLELYVGAVNVLKKAFESGPVLFPIRFEIINAYNRLGRYDLSEILLNDMSTYLTRKEDIAIFYRSYGYILVEKGSYECALACYKNSLKFEKSDNALKEIEYIHEKYKTSISDNDVYGYLINGKVPLIKELSLDDLAAIAEDYGITTHFLKHDEPLN